LERDEEEVEDIQAMEKIEEILHVMYERKTGGPRSGTKEEIQSKTPSVWNLQPHVRPIHLKKNQCLDNQILVEELQRDTHPIKEHRLEEPF
jgi:hypothetical protein